MKKIYLFIAGVIVAVFLWYLFIKPYDYKASLTIKALPGTINQTIRVWGEALKDSNGIKQKSINSLEQVIWGSEHTYVYNWEINQMNDSISLVYVYVTEPGKNLENKIMMPLVETSIEKDTEKNLRDFYSMIKEHLSNIQIKIIGKSEVDSTFCIYISVSSSQSGKAHGMMPNYPLLSSFIADHKLKPNGYPFVEVTQWDMDHDSIKYNFCLPILMVDSLPVHKVLKYKWRQQTKAIKAIYHGNYITSDRAWYALLNYAEKNGIEVQNTPIEIYHNNPNFGSNEKEWQADIYLPIK